MQKSGKLSKKGGEKGGKSEKNLKKRAPKIDAEKGRVKKNNDADFETARVPKKPPVRRVECKAICRNTYKYLQRWK